MHLNIVANFWVAVDRADRPKRHFRKWQCVRYFLIVLLAMVVDHLHQWLAMDVDFGVLHYHVPDHRYHLDQLDQISDPVALCMAVHRCRNLRHCPINRLSAFLPKQLGIGMHDTFHKLVRRNYKIINRLLKVENDFCECFK